MVIQLLFVYLMLCHMILFVLGLVSVLYVQMIKRMKKKNIVRELGIFHNTHKYNSEEANKVMFSIQERKY